MMNYFLSENLKTKNTFIQKLVYIAPILVFLLSLFLTATYYVQDGYNWWYIFIIPIFLSIECTLLASIDNKYNNCGVLALPLNLKKVWISKIFVLIKNFVISNLIIFFLVNIVSFIVPIKSVVKIPVLNGLLGVLIIAITYLWQIPIWLYVGEKFGMFISITLSMCINVVSQFFSTENCWFMIPFSYPARLMCPILKILPNGLVAEPGSTTFSPELLSVSSVYYGVVISIILFVIFTIITAKQYSKSECIK